MLILIIQYLMVEVLARVEVLEVQGTLVKLRWEVQ